MFGPAGPKAEWHHIVEQAAGNTARFGASALHNTVNVVRLDNTTHRAVSAYYSSKQSFPAGKTVREWLSTKSYKEQYEFGQRIVKFGKSSMTRLDVAKADASSLVAEYRASAVAQGIATENQITNRRIVFTIRWQVFTASFVDVAMRRAASLCTCWTISTLTSEVGRPLMLWSLLPIEEKLF